MLVELGQLGARARTHTAGLQQNLLVIGLGQVGLHAIAKFHTMLGQTLSPRVQREHIRLLAIAQRKSIRQEQLLGREYRLLLNQEPLRWSDIPGRYAAGGITTWWARTPNHAELQADPTPSRPFGRLLLWTNAEVVGKKLGDVAEWLAGTSHTNGLPATVLLLGSLAEPEGSGMIFDVAGRTRRLLAQQGAQQVGVLTVDADFHSEDERLLGMATAYAALKEIDSFQLQPELYPHEFPVIGKPLPTLAGHTPPLFDHICVAGNENAPTPAPEGNLAEFALTWVLNHLQEAAQVPMLATIEPPVDQQGRYRGYALFGFAKLALPTRAALNHHVIGAANLVLQYLLQDYETAPDDIVNKVMSRAHKDLMSKGMAEHHKLIDRRRELNNQFSINTLKQKIPRAEDRAAFLANEWDKLLAENEPVERDMDGVPIPRDVLRRRVNEALGEPLRKLLIDIENLAVTVAFRDGFGLQWTYEAFDMLAQTIEGWLYKFQEQEKSAERALAKLRARWLNPDHKIDALADIGGQMIAATLEWVSWAGRTAAWAELLNGVDNIVQRIDVAIQQVPLEIDKLRDLHLDLYNQLMQAAQAPPRFPEAVLVTEAWLREGVREMPSTDHIPPYEWVGSVFQRWDSRGIDSAMQLQRFPMEVLDATRLTLQPSATYLALNDFVMQAGGDPRIAQALNMLARAADPAWHVSPVTNKLDDDVAAPYQAQIVRESAGAFSVMPRENSVRRRFNVPSSDIDELACLNIVQGFPAEHIRALRDEYRRAYYRIGADNVPLHIDRRWETTMADLIHSSLRAEIVNAWEGVLEAFHTPPNARRERLYHMIKVLGQALGVSADQMIHLPEIHPDIHTTIFPMEPFRLKIPPPNCAFVFIMAGSSTSDFADQLFRSLSSTMLDENFFFAVNLTGRGDLDQVFGPLRSQSFMPLELTESDVKHVVAAPKPASALRDIVIARINLASISPFYTRAPVPDHMFFGREREISDVRSKLATHSVVLIGGRRIGKTSTLQKINRALAVSDSPVVPYYLDCSNVLKHKHFFRRIERDWGATVDDLNDPVEFDEVVEQLSARHPGQTAVFLLDEVDRLLKTDQADAYDEPLFRTFRSLSNQKQCQFVFSGEKLLMNSINNAHSVLFNFPKQVKLNPLSKEVVRRLVSEPFEMLNIWLEDSDELIQKVYEISAGHPNIVQTICHALVDVVDADKHSNLLKQDHLGRVLDQHQVQVDIIETIWGQMHPLAKLVSLLWQEDRRTMSLEDIIQLLQGVGLKSVLTQHVRTFVIPDLKLYNFIRQDGQDFILIPVFFPAIIEYMTDKKMEIKTILESLKRENAL